MKKIASLLIACCWSLAVIAQERPEGLGDFKIGMDRQEALRLLTAKFGKPSDLHHYYSGKQEGSFYRMAKPRNKMEFNPYYYDCAAIEAYAVPRISIAAIAFHNVVLTFGNERLLRIEADGAAQIDNAFTAKYGQPQITTEQSSSACAFDQSGTLKEQQTTTTTLNWRNDDIYCASVRDKTYDSDCKPKELLHFVIENKYAKGLINNCQINAPETPAPVSDSTKARLDEL